ncbi:S8 family serine peptidase [Ignisphaera sp. 4213-co]|uniref:S8 family serine peptidase n=1 Tax=Ignisphaera cupida TaxID=3050454 RepID=A0ABD4Z6U3_9CREN|nr:S8 family serine peptidase [Ignisphaera sp. 4213-co]MDK6027833.1 S8 family serine peptidase [Ignisphaera sp. 4213-co]
MKAILTLEQMGNETVLVALTLPQSISQQELLYIISSLNSTKFSFHGHMVPILFGKPMKLKTGSYVLRLYGPADLIANKINTIAISIATGISIKPLPSLEPRNFKAVDDLGTNINLHSIQPETNDVRDLIGASYVESTYGITGSGVKIAIVDTGVDYAHPDLQSKLIYYTGTYRTIYGTSASIREPLVLDADESQVILTNSFQANISGYINVGQNYFIVLIPYFMIVQPSYPSYYVGNIPSASGIYKFGMTLEYTVTGIVSVGVVMSDPETPGNYTLLVIDANDNGVFGDSGDINVTYDGSRILYSPALNLSLGVAGGFFYDIWWWFGFPGSFYPGWDLEGNYISIFYDFYGHGTACASAAAGNGRVNGIAKDASIIGVKALWLGDVEIGLLWAAGFDVNNDGNIYYTGKKRADVISNSWGISPFIYDISGFGYDFESMLINAITTPGFLDPSYPGTLVVQAAGNGGPGFGTVTSPGAAVGALTVGASTLWKVFKDYFGYGGYTKDNIIMWSARGPTPMGYIKPDIVSVGAWGITAAPVPIYYVIFGGTSYATPLTAGAAALLIQALRIRLGSLAGSIPPSTLKQILMNTADSLGYMPYDQGAGRVNITRAVQYALGISKELLITSQSVYSMSAAKMSNMWYWTFQDHIPAYFLWWYGVAFSVPNPSLPASFSSQNAYGIYVPDVPKFGRKTFTFMIQNPTSDSATFTVDGVYTMKRVLSPVTLQLKFNMSSSAWIASQWVILSPLDINTGTSILLAEVNAPFKLLDNDNDYIPDFDINVYAYVWINDINGNGVPDRNELAFVNVGYAISNYNSVEISNPRQLLSQFGPNAKLAIRVFIYRHTSTASLINFPATLTISQYMLVKDYAVSVPSVSMALLPGKSVSLSGTIYAYSLAPTTYQSFLKVRATFSDGTSRTYLVPMSYTVYTDMPSSGTLYLNLDTDTSTLMSPSHIRGNNDWGWRYEAGDWRYFYVNVQSPYLAAFEFKASWTYSNTSLITYALGPDGQFAGYIDFGESISYHDYIGGGRFLWTATGGIAGGNRSAITFPSTRYRLINYPTQKPNTGIYTLIVRTGLFDGSANAERFLLTVKPLTITGLPNAMLGPYGTATYTIQLPYSATRYWAFALGPWLPIFVYSYFNANVTPSYYSGFIPPGTTLTFTLKFNNYIYPNRVDISLILVLYMPTSSGLPVYYKDRGCYYFWDALYIFEDWIMSGSQWYWYYYWW